MISLLTTVIRACMVVPLMTGLVSCSDPVLRWQRLPDLPPAHGLGGAMAAQLEGALWVGGGSHFGGAMPWQGGLKTWHDRSFVLAVPGAQWREGPRLPLAMGYGCALSDDSGFLWVIGGGDGSQHFSSVWRRRKIAGPWQRMADLPTASAMGVALIWRGHLHWLCGSLAPTAVEAERSHWTLSLQEPQLGWQRLPDFPGPGRILAVGGANDRGLVIAGGAQLVADSSGKPRRLLCRDVYGFDGREWRLLADLPQAAVAAPGPMPYINGKFWLIGGDDGRGMAVQPWRHPGFSRLLWSYDPQRNLWRRESVLPDALVTTALVPWCGGVALPGGEVRPGLRSPRCWMLRLHEGNDSSR